MLSAHSTPIYMPITHASTEAVSVPQCWPSIGPWISGENIGSGLWDVLSLCDGWQSHPAQLKHTAVSTVQVLKNHTKDDLKAADLLQQYVLNIRLSCVMFWWHLSPFTSKPSLRAIITHENVQQCAKVPPDLEYNEIQRSLPFPNRQRGEVKLYGSTVIDSHLNVACKSNDYDKR